MATVLLDLSVLATHARHTGIGRYVADLATAIADLTPTESALRVRGLEHLGWLGDATITDDLRAGVARLVARDQPIVAHKIWAYQRRVALAPATRRAAPDLVHLGHPNATPLGELGCPRIVTCHDLIPLRFPEHYLPLGDGYRPGRELMDRRRYSSADHVICVSHATAAELTTLLGIPASRLSVVHNGVDLDRFGPRAQLDDAELRARCGPRGTPYALYVGSGDHRKNVPGMFAALAEARRQPGCAELELWWAGSLDAKLQQRVHALARERGLVHAVRLLGFVGDATLGALYRGAVAQLFVSLAEGFGYPVLEAMSAGCPVITSDRSSTAEIAGDAAWLVDPSSQSAIVEALVGLTRGGDERMRLRLAGRKRAETFSLRAMAEGTLAVYEEVLRRDARA